MSSAMYRVPLWVRLKYIAYCHDLFSERVPMLKTIPSDVWDNHVKKTLAVDYPTAVVFRDSEEGKPWTDTMIEFPTEAEVTMFVLRWGL